MTVKTRVTLTVAACLLLAGCGVQLRTPEAATTSTVTVTAAPEAGPVNPLLPPFVPLVGGAAGYHIQRPGWFPDWVLWLAHHPALGQP